MVSFFICFSLLCTLWLNGLSSVSSKRILIVPFLNTSHTIILNAVASRLAARGHSVSVLWSSEFTQKAINQHPNYTLFKFSTNMNSEKLAETVRDLNEQFASPEKANDVATPYITEAGLFTRIQSYFEMGREMSRAGETITKIANAVCRAVLSDELLLARLREQQFDIALVDDWYLARCLFLIPRALGSFVLIHTY